MLPGMFAPSKYCMSIQISQPSIARENFDLNTFGDGQYQKQLFWGPWISCLPWGECSQKLTNYSLPLHTARAAPIRLGVLESCREVVACVFALVVHCRFGFWFLFFLGCRSLSRFGTFFGKSKPASRHMAQQYGVTHWHLKYNWGFQLSMGGTVVLVTRHESFQLVMGVPMGSPSSLDGFMENSTKMNDEEGYPHDYGTPHIIPPVGIHPFTWCPGQVADRDQLHQPSFVGATVWNWVADSCDLAKNVGTWRISLICIYIYMYNCKTCGYNFQRNDHWTSDWLKDIQQALNSNWTPGLLVDGVPSWKNHANASLQFGYNPSLDLYLKTIYPTWYKSMCG